MGIPALNTSQKIVFKKERKSCSYIPNYYKNTQIKSLCNQLTNTFCNCITSVERRDREEREREREREKESSITPMSGN